MQVVDREIWLHLLLLLLLSRPSRRKKYDVFISFRGEDTRLTFISYLHDAFLSIKTYIDFKLERGDEIEPALLEAIEKSKLSVIILSKKYVSFSWCLIELAHILECKEKYGQLVIPIFYDINPSYVRKQKGSYGDAFAQHENRFKDSMNKVRKWRKALMTLANLSGFDYSNKKGHWSVLKKTVEDDKIYKVGGLKPDDAPQLFHLHAFKDNYPSSEHAELSAGVVDYARGIPLALQILGSLFLPCESKEEWEDMFNKPKKFPSKEIQNAFRLSYKRLEIHDQEVFLDIAYFYKGKSTEYVKRMLGIRGFFAVAGIRVLIDKSLISINSTRETIEMHDLLQEMGWAIVREQCVEEPGKRKRLFNAKDVYHVLKNNTGTSAVEAVFFNISEIEEQHLNRADFKKMNQLKFAKC